MLLRYFVVFLLFPSLMLACSIPKTKKIHGVSRTVWECCKDYKLVKDSNPGLKCVAICNEDCGQGECKSPYTCNCHKGYENYKHNPSNGCVPVCTKGCPNGECVAPEKCKCHLGYKLAESTGQCVPVCSGGCHNGHCVSPNECVCNVGYKKVDEVEGCQPDCEGKCGENSLCVAPENCSCVEGYTKIDQQCLISNTTTTTTTENTTTTTTTENPVIVDKPVTSYNMAVVISFLKHWMIEILAVSALVIILIMALVILISNRRQRESNVTQKDEDRCLYVCDNEISVF